MSNRRTGLVKPQTLACREMHAVSENRPSPEQPEVVVHVQAPERSGNNERTHAISDTFSAATVE